MNLSFCIYGYARRWVVVIYAIQSTNRPYIQYSSRYYISVYPTVRRMTKHMSKHMSTSLGQEVFTRREFFTRNNSFAQVICSSSSSILRVPFASLLFFPLFPLFLVCVTIPVLLFIFSATSTGRTISCENEPTRVSNV